MHGGERPRRGLAAIGGAFGQDAGGHRYRLGIGEGGQHGERAPRHLPILVPAKGQDLRPCVCVADPLDHLEGAPAQSRAGAGQGGEDCGQRT